MKIHSRVGVRKIATEMPVQSKEKISICSRENQIFWRMQHSEIEVNMTPVSQGGWDDFLDNFSSYENGSNDCSDTSKVTEEIREKSRFKQILKTKLI